MQNYLNNTNILLIYFYIIIIYKKLKKNYVLKNKSQGITPESHVIAEKLNMYNL